MGKKPAIVVMQDLKLEDIVQAIKEDWTLDSDDILKFILQIDEGVADYDFTKKLWKKLKKLTDAEDKAAKKSEANYQMTGCFYPDTVPANYL